jgi:cobalamin biosynthesis protein CobW
LPKPLIKAFAWPEVRTRVTVDGVIAVVDAEAVAAGRFAADPDALARMRAQDPSLDHESPLEELFEEQLQCADMVVVNKLDRVGPAERARAEALVAPHLRPAVRTVAARFGAVDPAILLGIAAAAEQDLDSRRSHHDGAAAEHDHDDFASFVVELAPVADPETLLTRIRAVSRTHDVLRIKGFAAVSGKPLRHAVQAVGERVQGHYDRPWRPEERRMTRLVVIGEKGLDRAAVEAGLRAGPS